ncbi:carboxymuconolactone decarboxylase family protein [Hymenobacter sp. 15J16-1T3B]|uniref:carboxymuconolactone decarboxylase family protein n=1 Tax=Hymenobacter sp. 15J16-1T3B TaxID=2886941 RepID=UPI001D10A078|nr:carboxymuconolactone decarboxylase family protein [Hymenobacter sp. 15J16-1T3B]MCC3157989.1 carboxymuconolactone decarboxylase family protein [Hymenobacter sp. 15J16-1T3B]
MRLDMQKTEPESYQAVFALEKYLSKSRLTRTHKELIKLRASQLNGCAYCLNMHSREARQAGETEQRLYVLSAWREAGDLFTPEERALLALTEEVTLIGQRVSDATYAQAAALFDEQYLAQAIMAIATINVWNRIAIATEKPLD